MLTQNFVEDYKQRMRVAKAKAQLADSLKYLQEFYLKLPVDQVERLNEMLKEFLPDGDQTIDR